MPLVQQRRDSLLRYSSRLFDQLSSLRPASVRRLATNAIGGLGQRTAVPHAHLFLVRGRTAEIETASLVAEWSKHPAVRVGDDLQKCHLSLLGEDVARVLSAGTTVFSGLTETTHACSRLVSGILRELGVCGYEMIPVIIGKRLRAIIGLAHDHGPVHLDHQSHLLIQLSGKIIVGCLMSARREQRRRIHHQQWKSIANGACDFALQTDARREIIRVIPFRQQKPPQIQGLRLQDFVAAVSYESLMESIENAISDALPRTTDVRAVTTSGRPCSYAVRIEPAAGTTTGGLTLYLTNNDAERAHAEELHCLREQLDRATRLSILGNIATEFAHQLTQPLQSITNNSYTLKSRLRSNAIGRAKLMECVESIEGNVAHAGDVINSLRDFLRDRRMNPSANCLRTMIEHAVTLIATVAERISAKIRILDPENVLAAKSGCLVRVDRVQTTHVIINLLMNALEACAAAKTPAPIVSVSAVPDERSGHLVVRITDNGPGIPPEKINSVFDRFFTTKTDGFGIGLAICRDVIERQHGSIRAENNLDCGCSFFFTVALTADADAE